VWPLVAKGVFHLVVCSKNAFLIRQIARTLSTRHPAVTKDEANDPELPDTLKVQLGWMNRRMMSG
jgi:hypothetical protein